MMVEMGRRLAKIHVKYKEQAEYPLEMAEKEQYIVRLVKQVITVSLETVAIVKGLPDLGFGKGEEQPGMM